MNWLLEPFHHEFMQRALIGGALIGGVSTVLLLIVQDEVSFVVFGVSVLVALTRIGPGLAALGVSRNPEGMVTQVSRETPRRRQASRVDAAASDRRRAADRVAS